jgi:hypothetical protein
MIASVRGAAETVLAVARDRGKTVAVFYDSLRKEVLVVLPHGRAFTATAAKVGEYDGHCPAQWVEDDLIETMATLGR